jgi:endonuclease/exonuclease/phosphatase family metal-dependent hydrolase
MKIFKKVLLGLAILIGTFIIIVLGYVIYMQANYYRIKDNKEVSIENNQASLVEKDIEYSIMTYNVGFGAYSQDFSFFMDEGEMLDGTKVKGKYGKARSKKEEIENINGSIDIVKEKDPDFVFLQEVDTPASRNYKVDERKMFLDSLTSYSSSYAINYHSSYIILPINDPMGTANSGILSLAKFNMNSSIRKSLPISNAFISKFTDLDRCMNIMRYKVSDKELVLINVHLSAYDKGGVYRAKQITLIQEILTEEYEKGNYVILGGDFNHDIAHTLGKFPTTQKDPAWVAVLDDADIPEHFSVAADGETWGSCRAAEMPYVAGENYVVTVDGFMVSDNITVSSVLNMNNDFLYSDHLPVIMKFKLN